MALTASGRLAASRAGHVGVTRVDGTILDFAGAPPPRAVNVGAFAFGTPTRWLALMPERAAILRSQVHAPPTGRMRAVSSTPASRSCTPPLLPQARRQQQALAAAGGGTAPLTPGAAAFWDEWLAFSAQLFGSRRYGLLTTNCHEFACCFLNSIQYDDGRRGEAGGPPRWDSVSLAAALFWRGRSLSSGAWLRMWAPAVMLAAAGVRLWGYAYLLGWATCALGLLAWFWGYSHCVRPEPQNIVSLA